MKSRGRNKGTNDCAKLCYRLKPKHCECSQMVVCALDTSLVSVSIALLAITVPFVSLISFMLSNVQEKVEKDLEVSPDV